MAEHWLVVDLGGSKTRVGLARPEALLPGSMRVYTNALFAGLAPVLRQHRATVMPDAKVTALCAGVAGPVRAGTAQLTNHAWFIDSAQLREATCARHVHLINDLQAQAYALDDLDPARLTLLFPGASTPPPGASRMVLGLGTGSNIAVAHRVGQRLVVPPSESGHASLPWCEGELGDLIGYLGALHPHRPMESALSGPGLRNIWRFLGGDEAHPEEIIAAGTARSAKALELFATLLGKVAGDLALAHLPMGGLFLIGGVARAIGPRLANSAFHSAFTAKGPYAGIMRDIPITLIDDDLAALRGCTRYLRQVLH